MIQRPLYDALLQATNEATVEDASSAAPRPESWSEIKPGCVVLAAEDPKDGWWDAVVLEAGEGVLQLRWIVEPRSAAFVRPRREVGLLPLGS